MKIAAVWLAFVLKKNCDGSPWRPEEGDRVCSDHFISGKKSDSATSPDFVPSIKPKWLGVMSEVKHLTVALSVQGVVLECKNIVGKNWKLTKSRTGASTAKGNTACHGTRPLLHY